MDKNLGLCRITLSALEKALDLKEGYRIIDIHTNSNISFETDSFSIKIESLDFPEVPEGQNIPYYSLGIIKEKRRC